MEKNPLIPFSFWTVTKTKDLYASSSSTAKTSVENSSIELRDL